MKIIFLCSSLEPGKDGVGDYTLRLAVEIIKLGYEAGIIALNDRFTVHDILSDLVSEGVFVNTLRLSTTNSYKHRFEIAAEWLGTQNPNWLSLQFVPFGFNAKGLPFGLAANLRRLGAKRKWHIMFHELWVAMETDAKFKFRAWGWLQKQIIQAVINKLRPVVVHTQTWLYKKHLSLLGVNASLLPLFSNIPLDSCNASEPKRNGILRFVLFGSIHYGAPAKEFANEVAEWGRKNNYIIEFNFVGRCGSCLNEWQEALQSAGISTTTAGEGTTEKISAAMQTADWGIVTTPYSIIEKSGSYAAMREHLLPVLCVSRKWIPSYLSEMPKKQGIFEYRPGELEHIINSPDKTNPMGYYNVRNAAMQFVKSLG